MKFAHTITLTVFSKPEEDLDTLKTGLEKLVPFNLKDNKIQITDEADTFEHRTIHILRITLKKINHTNQFVKHLLTLLSEEQKKTLLEQEESRIDEENNFFIRISKTMWAKHEMIELTDTGDCYHIKFTLACYPKNRDTALKLVKEMLSPIKKNI